MEGLKAKDIQNADRSHWTVRVMSRFALSLFFLVRVAIGDNVIDAMHQVLKQRTIDSLEECLQTLDSLVQVQRSGNSLVVTNNNRLLAQSPFQIFRSHSQQMTHGGQMDIGGIQRARFLMRRFHQSQVGRVQQGGRDTKDGMQLVIGEFHGRTRVTQSLVGFSVRHAIAPIVRARSGQLKVFRVCRLGDKVVGQLSCVHAAAE
mmetsp:Transcript_18472/g.39890  ORF Transcript_18472/g.39890 Transcript_18472/m.39890 type:complete len:203 (-) Transcript_18472:2026-2634(-)